MSKRYFFIIGFVFIISGNINAQGEIEGGDIKNPCATMIADSIRRIKHPELGTLDQFEQWFQQKIKEAKSNNIAHKKEVSYTLPVIFHVIHNGDSIGSGENISDLQIQSQIDALNENFGNRSADTIKLSTTYAASNWSAIAADCEISFCLAKADLNGDSMATPGIERIHVDSIGIASLSSYDIEYITDSIKPRTIWDPNKYLNIWVVRGIYSEALTEILGYATFPVSSTLDGLLNSLGTETTDGVVLKYNAVGTVGTLQSSYKKGRTAVHEVGHWLGLRHIWGDYECGEDYCDDTPFQEDLTGNCPPYPHVSICNNPLPYGDNFVNFMNYVPDHCAFMFTNDQKIRMHTAMANCPYRVSLANRSCEIPVKIKPDGALIIYPNPSSGVITLSALSSISSVQIYNVLGEVIIDDVANSTDVEADLTGYSSGIYFVKVKAGSENIVRKILLND